MRCCRFVLFCILSKTLQANTWSGCRGPSRASETALAVSFCDLLQCQQCGLSAQAYSRKVVYVTALFHVRVSANGTDSMAVCFIASTLASMIDSVIAVRATSMMVAIRVEGMHGCTVQLSVWLKKEPSPW